MSSDPTQVERRILLQNALAAVEKMQAKLDAVEQAKREPIAIIGMSCRFPGGANSPEAYWQLLHNGIDATSQVPPDRWKIQDYTDVTSGSAEQDAYWHGGFIEGMDQFDAQFFGLSPREVMSMDPQQRLVLELSWEALERAGQAPDQLVGSKTGIFIGITTNDYGQMALLNNPNQLDAYVATGGALNVAPGRVAYTLGLQGPSLAVDTACSSSLVALHLACQSLRNRESNMALAGGVNALLRPEAFICFKSWGMMSSDGHCKTFDKSADGFVRGEGCGIIVLKRLSDALANGDNILALIRGSAVNQDGRSSGLTVPNGLAQAAVVRTALTNAGVQPSEISYIEAHGTGTALGDPIEVEALGLVLKEGRSADQTLFLSSVKTNIGHLESAAGIAGIIKVVLAMQHQEIPPHLHLKERNPRISWPSFPVIIPTEPSAWPTNDRSRLAGVSAFGFSGTNAHVVLEEAPVQAYPPADHQHVTTILNLTARNDSALMQSAARLEQHLIDHPSESLADISFTLNCGRAHFQQRLSIVADSSNRVIECLRSYVAGQPQAGILSGKDQHANLPKIAFLFTGQGSQYVDMGRQLYETEPVFRQTMDRCNELLRPYLDHPLLEVLYPESDEASTSALLQQTAYTQPALFALEYSLAELWKSWGVKPGAVMGHSVGEYVAACVAGIFSLEDGLKLIARRGRLMQDLPAGGKMVAVFADQSRVTEAIGPYTAEVSIAAFNGPEHLVISGAGTAIDAVVESFAARSIKCTPLNVSHAFHSPLMDPMLEEFTRIAASIQYSAPQIELISNITGKSIGENPTDAAYWRTHVRQPVQFQKAMETLRDRGYEVFLEIGPQPTLLGMGQRCISDEKNIWLASLRQRRDDWSQMLESLGSLFVSGMEVDWEGFYQGHSHRTIPLPTYPFQRQRYWFKTGTKPARPERPMIHPLLDLRVRSPLLTGTVFEAELGVNFPAFLNDHRIYETAIFPGAAYMEMALAAAQQAFDGLKSSLVDIVIREVLVLPDEGEKTVQITVSAVESAKASFEIFSLSERADGSEESWKPHASGIILLEPSTDEKANPVDIEQLKTDCPNPVNVSIFYQQLADLGIEYGPAFRGLSQIWQGDNEALGQVILSPDDAAESHKYQLHPALLDACFQLLGAATPPSMRDESDKFYVPVGLQALKVHQAGQSQVWAHVSFSSPITNDDGTLKDALHGNIKLFGQDGALVAEVIGLQIMQISRDAIRQMPQRRVEDWLYELNWQLSPKPAMNKSTTIKNWLIFTDQNGIGDQLAEQLKAQGSVVALARPGDEYRQMDGNNWRLSPTRPDHFQQLMSDVSESFDDARPGIIHLWGLDNLFDVSNQKTDTLLRDAQGFSCGSILHLVQALAEKSISPVGLWLITRGVHAIKQEDELQGIVQASVWGLARTIVLEYPNWKCTCVDIAQTPGNKLLEEILSQDDENQIALRGEERFVARLERSQAKTKDLVVPTDEPFELVIPSPGVLDRLTLQTTSRRPPEAGEVEIRVKSTGLNFRDVLNALGMYPGANIPLGNECAGVIVALGDDVTEFKVGDEVIGLTTSAFRSFATVPVERVFSKPVNVSLSQAASIPTTFLTASYGLHHLAGMKAGDRVLIHAAAGGVGLAAVQLAQRVGAEIFGTAGSPEKRNYLKSLGVEHVFDSRNLDFAEEIMQVTNGKGVNIVLNSLADEFIPKSLSVLADHGYFLEMGKRDDWDPAKVSQLNPTLKYHRYDLGTEMVNDLPFIRAMLNELLSDFRKEAFKPLPLRTFPMGSVREAFRYMAQARHIGKIVITQEEETPLIREDGAYLITGGLGGLGLVTTRWLVERGAKYVVLMSRSEPTEQICEMLAELQTGGAEIITAQGDVSRREDVERVLQQIEQKMPPLRGLFHEAGVLDDGVLSQQNWSRFERVMAPKAEGAWHLHTLTQNMPLDFFVLFSTAAAVFGSAGQCNYTAANAFLDGLAHYRKSHGLPAMSINWGAWAEVGMAAGLDSQGPNRRVSRETDLIKPSEGMKVMGLLLSRKPVQTIVLSIKWNKISGKPVLPLLRQIVKVKAQPAESRPVVMILEQIRTLPPNEQESMLQEYAKQQVIKILGLDPSQPFNSHRVLTDLGMDSLMAVELKNKIEGDVGMNIPITYFLEAATVADLSKVLQNKISNGQKDPAKTVGSEKAKALLSNMDQFSDEEVDSLLDDLLSEDEDS